MKHDRLLSWRALQFKRVTATKLRESLTVERMRDKDMPSYILSDLVAFRHLTQEARQQACESFLRRKVRV